MNGLRVPRIPLRELPSTLAALLLAVPVEIGLRLTNLPRLARMMATPLMQPDARSVVTPSGSTQLPTWARERVRSTQRALKHWPFGDTCLRQALISGFLLRDLKPVLQVGVAKIDGEIRAHAWLVVNGAVVDPRFAASSYHAMSIALGDLT